MTKKTKNIFEILFFIGILMLSGCSMFDDSVPYPRWWEIGGSEAYQQKYVRSHPELSQDFKQKLLNGYIEKGMTKEEVQLFGDFRKGPTIVKSTKKHEADEMWIFQDCPNVGYKTILYFKSGILVFEEIV